MNIHHVQQRCGMYMYACIYSYFIDVFHLFCCLCVWPTANRTTHCCVLSPADLWLTVNVYDGMFAHETIGTHNAVYFLTVW